MDPVTAIIIIGAAGWIVRNVVEDLIAGWRGVPSPRIARRQARQKLALERIAAGAAPPLTLVITQRLADRIANPPERRWTWLTHAVTYIDLVISDGFEDAKTRHLDKRRKRAITTQQTDPASTADAPQDEPDDYLEAELVETEIIHERRPDDGEPVFRDHSRIPGLPCRSCGQIDDPLSVDNRCRACVRGKFGHDHYCPQCRYNPVDEQGKTCEPCAAGRFAIVCGCCATARQEPLCPMCTGPAGTCPICLPAQTPPTASTPEPEPEPEPTRKDTPVMPETPVTQSGTNIINGDVGSPEMAVQYHMSTRTFNVVVRNEIDTARNQLGGLGVGEAFLAIITTGYDGAGQFNTTIDTAIIEYLEHLLAKNDLSSNPDLVNTLEGYLSVARSY